MDGLGIRKQAVIKQIVYCCIHRAFMSIVDFDYQQQEYFLLIILYPKAVGTYSLRYPPTYILIKKLNRRGLISLQDTD